MKNEKGFSLVEVVVGLGILGIVGVGFLAALSTGLMVLPRTDELETAKNLAESQMEYAKSLDYQSTGSYPAAAIPGEYPDYSATISSGPITSGDGNIQKVTVTISHGGEQVLTLEGYKVNR